MDISSKYGEAGFDVEYINNVMGNVLVQACAAVALNKPLDPIEYLSLWLHKYCDNAIILQNYEREKMHKHHKEIKEKEIITKKLMIEQELKQQQNATLNYMRSITNDPYLLWDNCLKAITTYTGCQGAYIAVVIRKIFEPIPKKKNEVEDEEVEVEPEEGNEEDEEGNEGSDITSIDEEPPEIDEENLEEKEGGEETETEIESEPDEEEKTEGEEEQGPPQFKPFRPPKPFNYKNKRILYVSTALPTQIPMLNRQMVIKQDPVTLNLLDEELNDLHIPNVLYKEGVQYFGGCPRVGAYFIVPITIEYIAKKYLADEFKERPIEMFDIVKQKQVVALLYCDTLKLDSMKNGRPFHNVELDFIRDCAKIMSNILEENNKEIQKNHNTPEVIENFKKQLREIKMARVEQMNEERIEAKKKEKEKKELKRQNEFQEAHKKWEERQVKKARIQERLKRQRERKKLKPKDANEEEEPPLEEDEEVDGDDPEPILESDLKENEDEEEDDDKEEEEKTKKKPSKGELKKNKEDEDEEEEGQDGEEQNEEDEFNDEELEPNPMIEIEEEKEEGLSDEEGQGVDEEEGEEVQELEKPKEELDDEVKEEEPPPKETPEGEVEIESEDMIKLKEKKKLHAKKAKKMKKSIQKLTNVVKDIEKKKKKIVDDLEKLTVEFEKYERALFIANGVVEYLKKHMENVYNLLIENKIVELDRIRRWPYPNRHIQRILKALLHLLGHKQIVINDWNSARKLFNPDLIDRVIKNYDPLIDNNLDRWDNVDSYLMDLKDEKLLNEACIGFLLQQWLLSCKKTTMAGVNYHKIKSKHDELSKEYATLEANKLLLDKESEASNAELKKMVEDEEDRIEKEVAEIEDEEFRLKNLSVAEPIKE